MEGDRHAQSGRGAADGNASNHKGPAERAPELQTNQARQGVTVGLRYVLWIGLGLVIVAFAIIYFLNFR